MDREAIESIVRAWFETKVAAEPEFAWLGDADLTAHPAFLVDAQTKEGDDYKAGAVSIVVKPQSAPRLADITRLHDAVVGDRTLGNRAKRAVFEPPTGEHYAGTVVVVPR